MTTAKKMFRQRRATNLNAIPHYIKKWFAGEVDHCFHAYTYPYAMNLGEYWEAWAVEHPGAVKPEKLDSLIKYGQARKRWLTEEAKKNEGK